MTVVRRWSFAFAAAFGLLIVADRGTAEDSSAVEARLTEAIRYLASDDLEGRGIGTKGLDKAAEFIAAEFAKLGLKTSLYDGTPFQKFQVTAKVELGPKEKNRLTLSGPPAAEGQSPQKLGWKLGKEFQTLAVGGTGAVQAPFVFAGYGISAKDLKYDDYEGLDVNGKVVVLLRKEPQQGNPHSVFDGTNASQYATFMRKLANAYEHGAAAVVFVNDQYSLDQQLSGDEKRWKETADKLVEQRKKFLDEKEPSAEQATKHRQEITKLAETLQQLGKRIADNSYDKLLAFQEAGNEASNRRMPVFFGLRSAVEPLVKSALGKSLAELERAIDDKLKPQSAVLTGWKLDGEANVVHEMADVKNVLGVLEGAGPLADETIVIGAHYDHLGLGGQGNSLAPGTIAVHNGADDNASGTSALIEVARQLASRAEKPKRRLVFIAFTGEEKGLLGSAEYVKTPLFPLAKTIAMYNMDMVGRLQDNKLVVHGTGTAAELDKFVDELNKKHGFEITKKPSGFGPSDHSSFYAKQIPVLHLFTGTHGDYHRPSDDVDKINVAGMRRVAQFVTEIVLATDAAEGRPKYLATKGPQMSSGDRPYLGSIPDFNRNVEGYALMGAVPGSPADKAGMKSGDVIIQFGPSKIGGLEDIDSALRKFKAGETVPVVVLRGQDKVTLNVTLDPPK